MDASQRWGRTTGVISHCRRPQTRYTTLGRTYFVPPTFLFETDGGRALDEVGVQAVEKTLRDRKLAALWVTHSDEQERRVATRTIHLGPREGGGSIHARNTSVNVGDGDAGAETASVDSTLRKKRSGVRRTRTDSQTNK
jgi:hypothetical protein